MRVRHLSLTHFRLYSRLETDLPAGPLLLVGANAQGKTSLLEALFYLATAQSHHATSDRQLINFLALHDEPQPFARLVAEVENGARRHKIEIRLVLEAGPEGRLRKDVLVDNTKTKVGDLHGRLLAVMFLPQDLALVEGAPADRRRYLDVALGQVNPGYAHALTEYTKTLAQRNALLKQLQDRASGRDQLDFWDEALSQHGAVILAARIAALAELEPLTTTIHRDLTAGHDGLRLAYQPAFDPATPVASPQMGLPMPSATLTLGLNATDIRARLLERLRATRAEDIQRGVTQLGPHRDDVRLMAGGVDVSVYGSRGQARTAVLALKLAETEWMRQRTGAWPLLLLDEVLAELDHTRRRDLLARLLPAEQCVLTTTDASLFPPEFQAQTQVWQVTAGRVKPTTTR